MCGFSDYQGIMWVYLTTVLLPYSTVNLSPMCMLLDIGAIGNESRYTNEEYFQGLQMINRRIDINHIDTLLGRCWGLVWHQLNAVMSTVSDIDGM